MKMKLKIRAFNEDGNLAFKDFVIKAKKDFKSKKKKVSSTIKFN